jgi:hypothetical protein
LSFCYWLSAAAGSSFLNNWLTVFWLRKSETES